ncbi:MAG TPA: GIY-YIG nuclease family protein [Candidatus Omnitrophota bacterium]|nr:GIY-YIG nuclease family protein [Candidatus Omnitrophota bacterium]HRY84958.1 GIY-YIG nuclease family protein [Candidatus Omnitrophota bacterium]
MYYTYVLRSKKDGRLYTGYASDLQKRFKQHNAGEVPATKFRRPLELIYCEACVRAEDARARERYLKTGMGKRYLRNRLKRFLSLTGWKT